MKRSFLSLLVVPLLLISGYSSALLISDPGKNSGYEPVKVYIENGTSLSTSDILELDCPSYNPYSCDIFFVGDNRSFQLKYYPGDGLRQFSNSSNIPGGYYTLGCTSNLGTRCFKSINIDKLLLNPPLVNGGTANFTPVITGLTNSINEFIPYVVYIGLGVLGLLISFVAIKRLINWIRTKIFSSFK